ncbi:tRNA pseudouridine(38-40) synthase TruA [Boudabousia liubingyangii]|uniref:tRNA pseudouridine synthase A n=1 Tax=Boudabousia liubingyangii TaxID=1921764 RepID=A0A1Q5PQR2_9ACTO|nr:tRNA pseudouridine(38-40) synthase TruA [Boudabousia liubingyangii]OKL49740.1 tRNA pseudouridine(38-40) synthase TruA [Boudabousia liubingyangii]
METQRIKLRLAYDGTNFRGWATQPGLRTVQGELEAALALIFQQEIPLTVAGRTDAGVHAQEQVAHCDIPTNGAGAPDKLQNLPGRLEKILKMRAHQANQPAGDIVIYQAEPVDPRFDARFSARSRSYSYQLVDLRERRTPFQRAGVTWLEGDQELDISAMQEAAVDLLGEHDFLGYCKPREGASTVRTLIVLDVIRHDSGVVEFKVQADAFCHSMVRSLVGALIRVGQGKEPVTYPRTILAQASRDEAAPIAPPEGLRLARIYYPETPEEWAEQAQRSRVYRG